MEFNFTPFYRSKNFELTIFRHLPHLLHAVHSQTEMHRLKPNFSPLRKQYTYQQSKCKDGEPDASKQKRLNAAAHQQTIGKLGSIKQSKSCKDENERDQLTIGVGNYLDYLDKSDDKRSIISENQKKISENKKKIESDHQVKDGGVLLHDRRSSRSIKRGLPSVCMKTESDKAKAESMVNSTIAKKMKKTVCSFLSEERTEDDNESFGSDHCNNMTMEVDEDQNSKRKRTYSEELENTSLSSLPRPKNIINSKLRSCSDGTFSRKLVLLSEGKAPEKNDSDCMSMSKKDRQLKERANCCNNHGQNDASKQAPPNSILRSLSSSPVQFLRKRKEGDDSMSSSSEEYLQILGAAQELDSMGNVLFKRRYFKEALSYYSKALRVKRKALERGLQLNATNKDDLTNGLLASVATSMNNIGYLLQRSGVPLCEVVAAYQDSLQIKQKILGYKHLSVGKTLNNIGSVHFKNHKHRDALEAYEQARKIMVDNLEANHLDVATVYSNIGDVYLSTQNLELALQNYRESLKIRWLHLGHNHSKVVRLLKKIATIEMTNSHQNLEGQKNFDHMKDYSNDYRDHVKDLQELSEDIKSDFTYVEKMGRKMSLDMIRDRIKLIRGMRRIENGEDETNFDHNMNSSNNDCCSTTSSQDSGSDSSLILHGRKDALTILTESMTREDQHSHSSSHKIEAYIPSKSSITTPPPAIIRTVSNDFGAEFYESAAEVFEDWEPY